MNYCFSYTSNTARELVNITGYDGFRSSSGILPNVPEETSISMIQPLLQDHPAVLVVRRGETVGIIARSDLLKVISKNPLAK
jgi:predicted transcriptional regulator